MLTIDNVKYVNKVNDILLIKQEYDKDNNCQTDFDSGNIRTVLTNIGLDKNIFVMKDKILPFALYKDYLVLTDTSELTEHLLDVLNKINCDTSKLKTLTPIEVLNRNGLDDEKYFFIINSQYKINE
jgi:hypothetical protein